MIYSYELSEIKNDPFALLGINGVSGSIKRVSIRMMDTLECLEISVVSTEQGISFPVSVCEVIPLANCMRKAHETSLLANSSASSLSGIVGNKEAFDTVSSLMKGSDSVVSGKVIVFYGEELVEVSARVDINYRARVYINQLIVSKDGEDIFIIDMSSHNLIHMAECMERMVNAR